MAGDTRENTAAPATVVTVNRAQSQTVAPHAMPVGPPENANVISGGGVNTAGGKAREATFLDGLKSVRLSDLKELHKKPCVRDSLMTGIGAGFGIGGLRAIIGAPVFVACNWAVGSFVFGSFVMHEYCQRKRTLELQGMKRAVEVIDRKKTEKQIKMQEARDTKRAAKEAEDWTVKK